MNKICDINFSKYFGMCGKKFWGTPALLQNLQPK